MPTATGKMTNEPASQYTRATSNGKTHPMAAAYTQNRNPLAKYPMFHLLRRARSTRSRLSAGLIMPAPVVRALIVSEAIYVLLLRCGAAVRPRVAVHVGFPRRNQRPQPSRDVLSLVREVVPLADILRQVEDVTLGTVDEQLP